MIGSGGWKTIIWGCMATLSISLNAQQTIPPLRNFSTHDGIVELAIHDLVRDRFGLIWLGTPEGLYTYDGKKAEPFQGNNLLAKTHITCLQKDSLGQILAGTFNQGLFLIDASRQITRQFSYDPNSTTGISANRIHDLIVLDSGKIMVAIEKAGLDLFDPISQSFMNIDLLNQEISNNPNRNNTVLTVCQDTFIDGVFWLGTLDGLIRYKMDQDSVDRFWCNKNNCTGPAAFNGRENTIKAIFCDENELYLGTWGGGISVFNKTTLKWKNYKFETAFPASAMRNDVIQIESKNNDELWILAYRKELGIFHKKTATISFQGYKNIRKMYIDDRKTIWFGTLDNGLYAFFPSMINTRKYFLPFDLTNIIPSPKKGFAYAGVFGKSVLLEINMENATYRSIPYEPVFDKEINYLYDFGYSSDTSLYLLGISGVYRLEESSGKIFPVFSPFLLPENDGKITGSTSFLVDSRDNIWYATKFDGLYRYALNTGKMNHYPPDKSEGHTAWVSDLMEDSNGRIWYGSGSGFGYFEPLTQSFHGFPNSLSRSEPDDLPFSAVTSLTEDITGRIWLGDLNKGLGKIIDTEKGIIQTYSTESAPMINDVVLELETDADNVIWIRTREGISRYFQEEDRFEHLGLKDGWVDLRKMIPWPENEMIITTNNGYYRLPTQQAFLPSDPPEIHLKSISVFDQKFKSPVAVNQLDTLLLNYSDNFFTLDFFSLDFNYPLLTRHIYKMEGLHDEWIDIGNRQSISFTNLRGGNYKLHIRAGYGEGLWGPEKTLLVMIDPPFWQKTVFWLFLILGFIGITGIAYNRRIKAARKKAAARAEFEKKLSEAKLSALQARMNPHFLFNCLNSIKLLTLENDSEKASDYLTRFSRLVRLILNSSKQLLVKLADEVEMLRLYIEMESLRFDHEFSYHIELDPTIDLQKTKFPPMIIQVFVENAIKHGLRPKVSDKNLEIRFFTQKNFLICTVRDNGIGRKAASSRRKALSKESMGIPNTMERLEHLKQVHGIDASIDIRDLFENDFAAGTLVEIRVDMDNL